MSDTKVICKKGTIVEEELIKEYQEKMRGHVIRPGNDEYDTVRKLWNSMIDKYPSIIARCSGVADVMNSVKFARENDILTAVRGVGHGVAGNALCNGGMVIDLSLMRSVHINPKNKRAWVEPGATLGDFDHEAQAFGLMTPLGINSTTGVSGLTLGGGFGWLSRKYGLTIDNLISADVVTVEGKLLKANKNENPDLFWAIRGGGGNFGVVTSFEFQLHEIGNTVLSGLIVHPLEDARDVLNFYRDFVKSTPDELTCWFVMRKAPPVPFLSPEWHGKDILILACCYTGEISKGEEALKPLRSYGKPIADIIAPHPYIAWQRILDPMLGPGMRNYWKSHDFLELSDGLIDALIEAAKMIPDPQCDFVFIHLGGAVSKVPLDETAYTHRDAQFVINFHGRWDDPAKDEMGVGWTRKVFQSVSPYATGGVYINFMNAEEQDRVKDAYDTNYNKLVKIKNKYDPDNFFSSNLNIAPSVSLTASK